MSQYITVNPVTGERGRAYPIISEAELECAVAASAKAFRHWSGLTVAGRTELLQRMADLWRKDADVLAAVLTEEIGKPIMQARGEVALCVQILEHYVQKAAQYLEDEVLDIAGSGAAVVRTEPIGPLVGVMPWNYPYYQVVRFAAPNLALGNTVLIKHARNCPQAALAIQRTAIEAGLPDGVYSNIFADNAQVAALIADDRVRGVSLTGSERAGSAVGEVAGRHLKRFVLELGGSDPFVVLDGHDIDATVAAAVGNRITNGGQACTASKRFIVHDDVYESFVERFAAALEAVTAEDPTAEQTLLGPLSSTALADELAEQVNDAVGKGARIIAGSPHEPGSGAFFRPMALADVTPDMRAFHEELFGPVAVVHRAASEAEAIELANNSPYGLGAAIFTADPDQGRRVAEALEVGMAWINGTSKSAPDLPFGGVKRSGVGRELGRYGLEEFANKKLIRTVR